MTATRRYLLSSLAILLSAIVFLVPLFVIYRQLGLINTLVGISLSHVIVVLPPADTAFCSAAAAAAEP